MEQRSTVDLERVYVWELPVRLTHWVLFFSILVLSATGYLHRQSLHQRARSRERSFRDGDGARRTPLCCDRFRAGGLVRIYWLFAGNHYARLTNLSRCRASG